LSVDFSFKERDIERVQNRVAQSWRSTVLQSSAPTLIKHTSTS